jgi:hypothetical protein
MILYYQGAKDYIEVQFHVIYGAAVLTDVIYEGCTVFLVTQEPVSYIPLKL